MASRKAIPEISPIAMAGGWYPGITIEGTVVSVMVTVTLVPTVFVFVFVAGEMVVLMDVATLVSVVVVVVVETVVGEYTVEVPSTIKVSVE